MSYRQFEPHRLLSPYIDSYWAFRGNWTVAETIKLLPDGALDLIINPSSIILSDFSKIGS